MEKLLDSFFEMGERVLDWLASVFGVERYGRPSATKTPDKPVDLDNEYHTMTDDK